MGTVQNGNAEVFRTIVAAVAKHKAAQLVLSIGSVLRPEQIGPVPQNAIVVNHAPQLELLKKASVCTGLFPSYATNPYASLCQKRVLFHQGEARLDRHIVGNAIEFSEILYR